MLPFGGFLTAAASSRIPFSWSFASSPACQRRLQRDIEGGMGLIALQAPFENSKKSEQASTLRFMSASSMPFWPPSCARTATEARKKPSRFLTERMRSP